MGRSRYKIYEEIYPYFFTSSILREYPLFSVPEVAQIILEGFVFLQNKREVNLYGYVIMENHIHFLASADQLSDKIRLFKSFAARKSIEYLKTNGSTRILRFFKEHKEHKNTRSIYQVWEDGFHPKQIINDQMMIQKLEYMHMNPVKRGYVDKVEDWRYSSARNYLGMKALIPVTLHHI